MKFLYYSTINTTSTKFISNNNNFIFKILKNHCFKNLFLQKLHTLISAPIGK
jgi:hypothetical protein